MLLKYFGKITKKVAGLFHLHYYQKRNLAEILK